MTPSAIPTYMELKEQVETDLNQTALESIIAACSDEVVSVYGAHPATGSQVDDLKGGFEFLYLSRKVTAVGDIVSVVERDGDTETTLASNDYRLVKGGWALERRWDGTNISRLWTDRVIVTYTPTLETNLRRSVIINLVKHYLNYNGLASESIGDYASNTFGKNYDEERQRIMSPLQAKMSVLS